jgi:hypothetical protein
MDAATVVALLSEAATRLREDLELMETGIIKCECFGADVTEQHMGRMAARLARIEAVIDAHLDGGRRADQLRLVSTHESHPIR